MKLPAFDKAFEVYTDASNGAIGVVLMQEGKLVAYELHKFSEQEMRWSTHEKEILAVLHCLRKWRHYVQDKHTKVFTDNISLRYFQSQPKLRPKQARWQDFITEFDLYIVHKPGKANVLPDVLSRLPMVNAINMVNSEMLDGIHEAQSKDAGVLRMMWDFRDGKTAHGLYDICDGILYAHNKVYIPDDWDIKKAL